MNPLSKFYTILLFILLVCSNSINSQNGKAFDNVHIEFESELVSHGILDKFDEFFVDVVDDFFGSDTFEDSENSEEEIYEQYFQEEDYLEVDEELAALINHKEIKTNDDLNENYKKFVYKLCLLTALSKETTIYATETISF